MPILADYHMHSSFSGDSRAPMQDMAARAIALGYQEICFTEHIVTCTILLPKSVPKTCFY